jgi:hypothetical protein
MMTRNRFLTLGLALVLGAGQVFADVPGISKEELKALDAVVGTTMDGYNAKNPKQFYSTWAEQMKAVQTPQAFQSLYVNMYHKDYGTLKSRTIDESRSTFSEVNGLIMYHAVFSKKKGTLAVNFFKEGGKYKVQQVQVNP